MIPKSLLLSMQQHSPAAVVIMIIIAVALVAGSTFHIDTQTVIVQTADAITSKLPARVPIATSGDNVYIAWMTDKGTPNSNAEIIFRASTDSGATFGDKINLSNSSNIDSVDQEIAAEGDNVVVTWWERNQTSNTPVLRISTDNGATFGPVLGLAVNGTISSGE